MTVLFEMGKKHESIFLSVLVLSPVLFQVAGRKIPKEVLMLNEVVDVENVIHMIEWFEEQGRYLIVMERPEDHQELFTALYDDGELNEEDARQLFGLVRILLFDFNQSFFFLFIT